MKLKNIIREATVALERNWVRSVHSSGRSQVGCISGEQSILCPPEALRITTPELLTRRSRIHALTDTVFALVRAIAHKARFVGNPYLIWLSESCPLYARSTNLRPTGSAAPCRIKFGLDTY
jgi:hypothetical protein